MRYLDPKNDLTFKRIFVEHPHLCMSLLNSLLPLSESGKIVELEYLSPEMVPEIPLMKNTIVDVRCKDKQGRQFIVEMQMYWTDSFMSRVVFNTSKAYVRQLDATKEYKLLQPVYALSLVNDIFEPGMKEYYHHFKIVNVVYPEKQIDGLEFVFVELPKFKAQNLSEKKLSVLWLKFLTGIDSGSESIPEELMQESVIKEAVQCLENSSYTKGQLEYYDQYWDIIRTERSAHLDAEERGETKGRAVGMEIGKVEGIEIGKVEGIEIGKVEGIEIGRIEGIYRSAIMLLRNEMEVGTVASLLALSPVTVHKLKLLIDKYGMEAENHIEELN
jgi:predicted transposase/invertase (TIGR01784 family)